MKTLAELHEVMRGWPDGSPCREKLADRHVELRAAISQFAVAPTDEALTTVNGLWAAAWRVLEKCGRYTTTPGGKGGAMETPKKEKAA